MNKYQKEYIHRINNVIDYVENNLNQELSLQKLADVANFSPFHFHRLFSALTGETLNGFIIRKRVERAGSMLLSDDERTITDVAYECGFNSVSVFCRNFKTRFGTNAQDFRATWKTNYSKIHQLESKNEQIIGGKSDYVCDVKTNHLIMNKNIEIKDMPQMKVLYCRHMGAFDQIGSAYEKLYKWAGARGLLNFPETKGLTYYHDDPAVTELNKIRQSACITLQSDVKPEGEIGKMTVPGGRYVVGHFEISATEFQQAWDAVCVWLTESGYQPSDGNPYELYHNNHEDHPEKKFVVDICIPVKPM